MNMEEQLRAVVNQTTTDAGLWHNIVHGDDAKTIDTENGQVPSVAKQLKDIRNAIMGGVVDIISVAEKARDDAISAKNSSEILLSDFEEIRDETQDLRNETETFKDISQNTFNNIATATNTAVLTIQNEASSQIANVESKAQIQINLAEQQAERAETAARTAQFMIEELGEVSGETRLLSNKVYCASVIGDINFVLPQELDLTIHNQIKILLSIPETLPTIDWATTYFYQEITPDIELGNYIIYFDYDNILSKWICGVVRIGESNGLI